MAVDLSNRTFLFKETLPVLGNFMAAKFSAKKSSPSGLYFSAISQITSTLTFQYVPGTSSLTVYNNGWVDNDYRRITFADGVSVSDSLYEWLTQLADEVEDPFLTKTEDLDIVANAIRERSWDYRQMMYPNGYAAAISAIGNRVTGGTVGWNQIVNMQDNTESAGGIDFVLANGRYQASGLASSTFNRTIDTLTIESGHIYLMTASGQSYPVSASSSSSMQLYGANIIAIINPENSTVNARIGQADGTGSAILRMRFATGTSYDFDFYPQVFDLTAIFGDPLAQYLLTLETNTLGAGVSKFRELFPDDYYPYNTGSLLSVAYGEWPQNTPKTLYGVLDLHDDSWVRYGDIYTNRIVYEQMRVRGFIGTPSDWGYNNIHDFFYTTSRPGGFGYYSFFMSFDKIGPCITDAYPYGGSFNAEQTGPTEDPTLLKDGYWMVGWLPSVYSYQIYVKDSSITSDHLNEFASKNAGKTLIGFTNNRQFVLP